MKLHVQPLKGDVVCTLAHEVMLSRKSSSSRRLSGISISAIPSSEIQVNSGFFKSNKIKFI